MRIKVFAVSILDPANAEEALNRFLASHQVVTVEKEFMQSWLNVNESPLCNRLFRL